MKIVLIAPNFGPEFIGCGKYSTDIACVLRDDGHTITVLTGNPHYPNLDDFQDYEYSADQKYNFDVIRVVNNLGSYKGLLGKLHDAMSYGYGVYKFFKNKKIDDLDSVIVIAPYIFTVFFLNKLIKHKIPIRLHIQDNELRYIEKKFKSFSIFTYFLQRSIFSKATYVSTISNGMADLIQKYKKNGGVKIIRNWADNFDDKISKTRRQEFKILYPELFSTLNDPSKIILYSGNIGKKQGLEICVNAVDILRNMNAMLIIVGDGSGRERLKEKFKFATDVVKFYPFVEFKHLDILLKSIDLALVPQLREVEDLVFPSKLHNILAVNKKVLVGCSQGTELYDLQTYNDQQMFWTYTPEDIDDFRHKLLLSLNSKSNVNAQALVKTEMHMRTNVRKFLN